MKTLGQIVEEIYDGGKPDYESLRYAMVAINALRVFDQRALLNLYLAKLDGKKPILTYDPEYQANESLRRAAAAFEKSPKEYVGPSHDPDTEECQRWRRLGKKLMAKLPSLQTVSVGNKIVSNPPPPMP